MVLWYHHLHIYNLHSDLPASPSHHFPHLSFHSIIEVGIFAILSTGPKVDSTSELRRDLPLSGLITLKQGALCTSLHTNDLLSQFLYYNRRSRSFNDPLLGELCAFPSPPSQMSTHMEWDCKAFVDCRSFFHFELRLKINVIRMVGITQPPFERIQ